ncbi:MAG TPA: PAS domain S-box protein [Myxococcota bacterium]|nr:PAS domain S-box protein [Myxococcota bacterium]
MSDRTIQEILSQLADLRERLPAARADPVSPDSSWLASAERDERLGWVLEQARAVMVELDQDARILFVSPNVEQITGYRPDEFRGIYVGDRVHPEDLERLIDVSRAMVSGSSPERVRLRAKHRSGGWVHFEAVSAARFRACDGRIHSVSVLCDVTERHEAWERLRESEARYRVIVEANREAILELDDRGRSTFQGGVARDLLGLSDEELSGVSLFTLVHPEDHQRVEQTLRAAFRSGETVKLRPFRIRRHDGHWMWYECTGLSYRRADGERRFIAVGRDFTERRREEEERRALERRMEQVHRLESLGVLAGGIAHDFNNLLTPIIGEARLALGDLPVPSPLRERLERILRAAQRAADLTRKMLANAGAETLRTDRVDLSQLVDEMAHLVGDGASDDVAIRYELAQGLPRVDGDVTQIGQVIMNLVTNALEALGPGGGVLKIRTGEIELFEALPNQVPGLGEALAAGHYVYLEVEDSGCGMSADTLARIFDPFFTTKFTGRGLGLAAVLGIVRSHEGGIEIDSRTGEGTRFRVLFPAPAA